MIPHKEGLAVRPLGRLLFCCACFWMVLCLSLPDCAFAKDHLLLSLENRAGDVLYAAPVRSGSVFAIRYQHSVALSPVIDYFVVKNGSIWLDRTVYQDFGAGLPHAPEGGQVMRSQDGNISISGFNRRLGSFQLRVGRVANHILLLMPRKAMGSQNQDWQEIPLATIAEPGSAITFAIRRGDS